MSIDELEKSLDNSLAIFNAKTTDEFAHSQEAAIAGDLYNLAGYFSNTLSEMKDSIIAFLREK